MWICWQSLHVLIAVCELVFYRVLLASWSGIALAQIAACLLHSSWCITPHQREFPYLFVMWFLFTHLYFIQTYLGDIEGSFPDHSNKVNIWIKQITQSFDFSVHIKVLFILYRYDTVVCKSTIALFIKIFHALVKNYFIAR